ncbi:hypothetical protein SGCOL_001711 [Colletotrichum sp. CLE4]
MLFSNVVVLLAANLATGTAVAVGTSSDVTNLDATDLQRRAACAPAGVVNGQCGRYYRGTSCSDQIGAIGPGVHLDLFDPASPLWTLDAADNATTPPTPSPASEPSATGPTGPTVTCTTTTIAKTKLARLETL